jgi:hypothetical protein
VPEEALLGEEQVGAEMSAAVFQKNLEIESSLDEEQDEAKLHTKKKKRVMRYELCACSILGSIIIISLKE